MGVLGKYFQKARALYRYFKKVHKVNKMLTKKGGWGGGWNFRKGFLKSTVETSEITRGNYKDFISDRAYRMKHPVNREYSQIIDNKMYLPLMLSSYKEHLPKYYYFKDKGKFHLLNREDNIGMEICLDNGGFLFFLRKQGILVAKRGNLSVGRGFYLLQATGDDIYINNEQVSEASFYKVLDEIDNSIISEYIEQHSYAKAIAPDSLNTIRFLVIRDADSGKFELLRSFHRFGTNGNIVDNIGSGDGVCAFIDVQSGMLTGEGIVNFGSGGERLVKNLIHPNSGIPLKNMEIPNFQEIKKKVLHISDNFPYLRYIGWDVAVTEDGFKIIETNSLSSLSLSQQGGLLKEPLFRKVFGYG